jgi:hypothetical protein
MFVTGSGSLRLPLMLKPREGLALSNELIVSVISAVISLGAAIAAAAAVLYARRTVESAERARRQQYLADLRSWADETTDILSDAVHLCEIDDNDPIAASFAKERHGVRSRLSALIDRGRWFFPNDHESSVGTHKGAANRGLRRAVLDAAVDAYRILGKMSANAKVENAQHRDALVDCKKRLVNEVHVVLDPRAVGAEFGLMIHADRVGAPTVGQQEETPPQNQKHGDLVRITNAAATRSAAEGSTGKRL